MLAGFSLLMVFVFLGVVFIFVFSLFAFAFYRELYDNEAGLFCRNMYECFITNVHRGLVIGAYEVGRPLCPPTECTAAYNTPTSHTCLQ